MDINDINSKKYIFYQKNAKFRIWPVLNKKLLNQLDNFLSKNGQTNNFWTVNKSYITINDNSVAEDDILRQLILIIFWLFEKNYLLDGSFYCWINGMIEYISISHNQKTIVHYILYDNDNLLAGQEKNIDIGDYIIRHTKAKIDAYLKSNPHAKNQTQYQDISYVVINDLKADIKFLREKLVQIEERINFLTRIGYYFYKLLNAFSLVLMAPLFVLGGQYIQK